ncbi:MAG TPA: hypothetical protein VHS30_21845, partial [Streptosporangiaceae bacterium]|nr:hypothetical protein [Streptosporangiaceae bacterium]
MQTRPCDQVAHCRADEDLTCAREGRHAGTDVDSDAPDSLADHLDFAGVNAGLDLDSERLHAPDCGGRTPDGAAGTVEHGEETVAGRVNLAAAETGQLATHEGVMALEKLPPRSIT